MPPLILLPFGVFFVCCLLQFWFFKKVRDALIERHPEKFLAVEKSSVFPMQGLRKFTRGNRYKELGDASLNRQVRSLKRLMIVAYVAWGLSAISLFTAPFDQSRLPTSLANGVYANECCGTLTLKDGAMSAAGQQVRFVIDRDNGGPYVLPSFYVGAAARGLVFRRNGQALKLHLNSDSHPAAIELMDDNDGSVFSFRRTNGS